MKEYYFFKNKRPLFDISLDSIEFSEENFKNRDRQPYFEYGEALNEVFSPKEILDIGCANGYLLEYFYKNGIKDIAGFEFADAAFKYMAPEIRSRAVKIDLSKNAAIQKIHDKKYCLVNCTEVGEHIPCKYEDIFLKNVVMLVKKYLVLSWADTWEGWHGFRKQSHVNPRSRRYVKKKLHLYSRKFLFKPFNINILKT